MGIRSNITAAYGALRGRGERANPVGGTLFDKLSSTWGLGDAWAKTSYGDYYPASVSVYAAVKLRQDAIASVPLKVYAKMADGDEEEVGPEHPTQKVLDRVNNWWTRGDLWRATETYLSLWGSAYWALTREAGQVTEIWPLRPDKMRILPDKKEYIKGFLYGPANDQVAFAPDEIVWFRYFNPLDEYSGMSPIAPVALSVDMGMDALRGNRFALANDATPGMIISVKDSPTDEEVLSFYQRWEQRFMGPTKVRRPAILGEGMSATNLGFSPKDMMSLESMRWSVEDVARTFNVPMPMLHDLSRATYANIMTARRSFWEDCILPQLAFYEEELTEMLLPLFNDESLVVRFDTSDVAALQEDEDAKATRREKYVRLNIMTINEVRADMGMEPVEWGDGESTTAAPAAAPGEVEEMVANGTPQPPEPPSAEPSVESVMGLPERALSPDFETDGRAIDTTQRRKGKKLESNFHKELGSLLRQQANQVIREYEEEAEVFRAPLHSGNGLTATAEVRQPIFRPTEWMPQFTSLIRKHLTTAVMAGGQTQVDKYRLGIDFDITAPHIKGWVEGRSRWWANTINDGTEKKLFKILGDGRKEGLSSDQIAAKLRDFREFQTDARSQRVARTEMTVAQGQGSLEAFAQAEVPGKQWYTALDERVRESHSQAHGQVVAQREMFTVGYDRMEAPGQGSIASENVNCRCVVLPAGLEEGQ